MLHRLRLVSFAALLSMPGASAVAQPAAPSSTAPAAPPASAPATTQYRDALRLIDAWLDSVVDYERVPSLSAGVVIGDTLVWSKGYGWVDAARTRRPDADTLYGICSISKLFTAVGAMRLWDAGKLALDDDISRTLPQFAITRTDPDSGPITARALLTHSSGVPREILAPNWSAPTFTAPRREQIIADLARQRTYTRAADHHQYSNLGMFLVGEMIAAVAGESFEDYTRRNLLEPLGMRDTVPRMPTELLGTRLPPGFGALQRDGTRPALGPYDLRGIAASAGYFSTVNDLAKFAQWQFRLLRRGGAEILRASTLREMHRQQWSDPDGKNTWGLGFSVAREGANTVVGHGGVCPGYETGFALALKDEIGVIALAGANAVGPYTRQMRQLLFKGLRLPERAAGAPDLDSFAGLYGGQPHYRERLVVPWGRDLAVLLLPSSDPAGTMQLLRPVAGDTFRLVRDDGTLGAEYVFQRDAAGRVAGYTNWNYSYGRLDR